MMLRIILPPGPMTSRILSTGILMVMMRGANVEMFVARRRAASSPSRRGCAAGRRAPARAPCAMISDVMPVTLMSICSAVMPLRRAGDLEVHVAVVILGARDVREDGPLAGLLVHDEAHRDAGDRRLDRHARVHHRHRAAADRRHRRRAVRLEDVGDEADGVGELVVVGHDRRERALGQRAVADFAAAGAA